MIVQSFGQVQALTTPQPNWGSSAQSSVSLYDHRHTYLELFRREPNVRICVEFYARNIADVPAQAYRRVSDTDRERLANHDSVRWLRHPNPATTGYRLIEDTMIDWGIYQRAYWVKVRYLDANRRPAIGFVRLPPEDMTVEGGLLPTGFIWTVNGRQKYFAPSEIVHFCGYRLGISPLETLRRLLAEEAAAGEHREGFWRNAARVEGIVTRPKEKPAYNETQAKSWRAQWQAIYAGGAGAGKTMLLQEGETFTPTSWSAKDSEYTEGGKLRREICAAVYQIPQPFVGILDHATFCLPGDTEVFTAEGPRPIADVREHDDVWSLSADGAWALQPVQRSACTGYDQILTVHTGNRTLRLNERHRVLVRRVVAEVPATVTVMADGRRRSMGRATNVWQSVYVPAADLRVGDTLVVANHLPAIGHDTAPSGRVLTVGFMEACGLLVGDGNISRKHGEPVGLQFARSDRATYMEPYRESLRTEFRQRGGRPITLVEGGRQTRFMSVTAGRELDRLGFGGTARTKRVPGWVFQTSEPLRLAFLRGFLDADGSVDKKGRLSFASCNPTMLSQVRHLCVSVGVPVTNQRCQRGQTKLPNGRLADFTIWTFTCSDPGENRRIGSHTPSYVDRLAAGVPFGRKARRYHWHGGRGFDRGALHLSRVHAIERSAVAEPVYDLDVAETHNFIADGVVVHNSNIREQHKNLYQDCLGPTLQMLRQEYMRQILIECEDQEDVYLEHNIDAKLAGTPEERASSMQMSIGRPWRTVNEGRALDNLPRIDDPALDTVAPQQGGPSDASAQPASRRPEDATPPGDEDADEQAAGVATVVRAHWARQQTRLAKQGPDQVVLAFDWARWRRELATDLTPLLGDRASAYAARVTDDTYALVLQGADPFAATREVPHV